MKTALLIIDIQEDYFPGGRMELYQSTEASLRAKEILSLFRERNLPVFHIQHISMGEKATFFLPNTNGIEIHPNVAPRPEEPVIEKHFPNSFRDTDLLNSLREAEIDSLVVCGMMTHMCVDATVRAAFDHRFQCTVIHDACATRALTFNGDLVQPEKVQGAFLAAFGAVYARICSSAEFAADMPIAG